MPPQVVSFDNNGYSLADKIILFDTSIVWELSSSNYPSRQQQVKNFVERISNEGALFTWCPKMTEELIIRAISAELEALAGSKDPKAKKKVLQQYPETVQKVINYVNAMEAELTKLPAFQPFDDNILYNNNLIQQASKNAGDYNLQWGDAVHYTIYQMIGADAIATIDGDYLRITDSKLIIFTDRYHARIASSIATNNTGIATVP